MTNWFSKYVVPRVKFLHELSEQVYLLTILNEGRMKKEEEYLEGTFPFRCPNCSGSIRIDKIDPQYDYCSRCGKYYMELFFAGQKIFKVYDGCVAWWVSATSDREAVEEVIKYENTAGCDVVKECGWEEGYLDELSHEISIGDAKMTTFWSDYTTKSTMWDEFIRDSSTRVIGCSEW